MGYRFLKLGAIYAGFVRQFVSANPDWQSAPYAELYERFLRQRYASVYIRSTHLAKLGAEGVDFYPEFEPLQRRWADERGISLSPKAWCVEILLAQVAHHQPDVIYLEDLYLVTPSWRERIRAACHKPVVLIGWRFMETADCRALQDLDLVLTGSPAYADQFRDAGLRTEILPLGFDPDVLGDFRPLPARDLPLTFLGGLGGPEGLFSERYALIRHLLARSPLRVWGEAKDKDASRSFRGKLQARACFVANQTLGVVGVPLGARSKIPVLRQGAAWTCDPTAPTIEQAWASRLTPSVFGLEYYRVLARSQVTVNKHVDVAGQDAGNARLFEATGMGACLLTDWKRNVASYFKPDEEVVTYRSPDECREKAAYLLEHSDQRERVAKAGQTRTLAEHTLAHRADRLHELIQRELRRIQ